MKARKLAWLGIFAISLSICFACFNKLSAAYPCVSYRFLQPVKASSTKAVDKLSTAYWYSQQAEVFFGKKSRSAKAICVYGSPFLCYPMIFINGSYSGSAYACAVSDALAFKLFNSTDIVGLTVKKDNKAYIINGVFNDSSEIIICPALKTDSFDNVEIEADFQQAGIFAASRGLPSPDFIIDGQVVDAVFCLILFLPLIFAALILIFRLFKTAKNKELFAFVLLICLACTLPLALNALPDFLVPSKFSDFSFYENLYKNAGSALNQWFSLPPTVKDAGAKYSMLGCVLSSLTAVISCIKFLKK